MEKNLEKLSTEKIDMSEIPKPKGDGVSIDGAQPEVDIPEINPIAEEASIKETSNEVTIKDNCETNKGDKTAEVGKETEGNVETINDGDISKIYDFKSPGKRHFYNRLSKNSRVKGVTTVIDPSIDVNLDVDLICSGKATRIGNDFHVNNRVYGVTSNGELFPRTGEGFYQLDRGTYNGLILLKEYGNTELGLLRMQQSKLTNESIEEALRVYNSISGK